MPNRTCITKQEKTPPGHKPIEEEQEEEERRDFLSGDEEDQIPFSIVKDLVTKREEFQKISNQKHVGTVVDLFNEKVMTHFRDLLKKTETLNSFFQLYSGRTSTRWS